MLFPLSLFFLSLLSLRLQTLPYKHCLAVQYLMYSLNAASMLPTLYLIVVDTIFSYTLPQRCLKDLPI